MSRPAPRQTAPRGPLTRIVVGVALAAIAALGLQDSAGAEVTASAPAARYVRLTNYASGLCMPEIAVLAGLERLDMMLNDSMYGILFRDINPIRTFVDQRFSRQVH